MAFLVFLLPQRGLPIVDSGSLEQLPGPLSLLLLPQIPPGILEILSILEDSKCCLSLGNN